MMQRPFSHIYIERDIQNSKYVASIQAHFPQAKPIIINHYKDMFNRPNQNFRIQKATPKLILAKKKNTFLYPVNENVIPNLDHRKLFYSSSIINCLYDCSYCYLQGAYQSANMLIFINIEDFVHAGIQESKHQPISLAISYDTDLLAFENVVPHCRAWIEAVKGMDDLYIEIRTKSVNFKAIEDLTPMQNVVLAWSLSPQEIAKQFESGTPSLKARLKAIRHAVQKGWLVRICIDPVLWISHWKTQYASMIEQIFDVITPDQIKDIYVDSFRMNRDQLKRIQSQRHDPSILFYPFQQKQGIMQYTEDHQQEIKSFLKDKLLQYLPQEKIF